MSTARRTTRRSAATQLPNPRLQEPLLRPEDAARLLSVKPSWIYEAVRARRMPCVRIGRHIRFTQPMIEEWLAANTDA
jgi:excisionase family DNA binding protein